MAGQLNALSPLTVLSRGYAVVYSEKDTLIRRGKDLKQGDGLIVKMADGKFRAIYDKPIDELGG